MTSTKFISDYLNEDYNSSALYLNYRATPSYIDGLKNGARKIVYTVKKNNLKEAIKVTSLGGKITTDAQYLHGDASIQGVIVTAAKDYTGSNNLPFLKGEGNFGSRFLPEASSARYIFAKPNKYFNELFRKEDDINLISQKFEGDEIEPRFYVPTIPLVLVNGCTGIGVGFSSNILNRSTENIIKALKNKMDGIRNVRKYFYPSWNGFTGTVEDLGNNKWQIKGVANLTGKKKLLIEELPTVYDLKDYLAILEVCKEKDYITSYLDFSDSKLDRYKFEVTLSDEESKKDLETILTDLKLIVNLTENLTCLDENNVIVEFNSAEEIFNRYYNTKIRFLEKRIDSEIKRLSEEYSQYKQIYEFLYEITVNTIDLKNKREILVDILTKKGYTIIDKLLSMPIVSITEEKVLEAKKRMEEKLAELNQMKTETPISLWKKDLEELEKAI